MIVDVSQVLFICQKNHFISHYGSTQLHQNDTGGIEANNPLGIFQQPQRKTGVDYGCSDTDINTIRRYRGVVRFLSSVGVMVKNTFGDSIAETETGYIGWLKQAVSQVKQLNLDTSNGEVYWMAGIDPKTSEYNLTVFNIPLATTPDYLSFETAPTQIIDKINRTLVIDLESGALKGFASFTPEYYGLIPSYYEQTQFLSFKQGQPYLHHNSNIVVPSGYFYDTQCPCVISVVVNTQSEKVKRYFACELYVKQSISGASGTFNQPLFFVPINGIETEKGQTSQIPPLVSATGTTWAQYWNLADGFQSAAFLCDENTPFDPNLPIATGVNKFADGNPLMGRWMKATFITNNDWQGGYFELSAINTIYDNLEKIGD